MHVCKLCIVSSGIKKQAPGHQRGVGSALEAARPKEAPVLVLQQRGLHNASGAGTARLKEAPGRRGLRNAPAAARPKQAPKHPGFHNTWANTPPAAAAAASLPPHVHHA